MIRYSTNRLRGTDGQRLSVKYPNGTTLVLLWSNKDRSKDVDIEVYNRFTSDEVTHVAASMLERDIEDDMDRGCDAEAVHAYFEACKLLDGITISPYVSRNGKG